MNTLDAVLLIENPEPGTTLADILPAWQTLIDSGVVWQLQGFYGRTATGLINSGMCTPASNNS